MNGRRQYMMFGIALAALLAVTLLVGMMRLDGREPAPVATIGVGQSTEVNGLRLTFVSLTDQVSVENVDQPERPAVASPGAIYAHAVFKVDVLEPRKASDPGRRSPHWLKVPHRPTISVVIGGWRPESVRGAGLGAVLVGRPAGSLRESLAEARPLPVAPSEIAVGTTTPM